MNTTSQIGTLVVILAFLVTACATGNYSRQPQVQGRPTATSPAVPSKQPTKERFVVDIVTADKSQMKTVNPPCSEYYGEHSEFIPGPSGGTKLTTMMVVGNYIVKVKPLYRKPLRLTLFGVSEPLTWTIDNSAIAVLSSSGREAFLDFKADGKVKIIVRSGENVVFRLGANAFIAGAETARVWQVVIDRENQEGRTINMYGELSPK